MLSQHQITEFREALKKRFYQVREDIRQELLKTDDEQYIELAGKVHDLEEESFADMLVDLNLNDIHRHVEEIREIDAALLRIADGSYGTCVDCEDPIAVERLTAYPTARRCHRCQDLHEKTYSQTGHPSL